MKRSTDTGTVQYLPLNTLKKSPKNARSVPHTKTHIEALADNIHAFRQLQNLLVETEVNEDNRPTGFYLVTAGEGRRLAQLLRVKRKQIKSDHPIPCLIDDTQNAHATSLAENELRQSMHPADQFVAFKQLVDGGQSIEDVAAQFSVSPLVVQRRLKLANVAPEFIEQYRKGNGKVSLDVLMALALTDDHAKQRDAWKNLPKHEKYPHAVRRLLTEQEISIGEPIVKFVGLKTYEKAGGGIRRDLFAESQEDGFVMDAELLRRLATEKLEKAAAKLKEDGCTWVDIIPELDYSTLNTYGRVQRVARKPNKKEQTKLDRLNAKKEDLENQSQAAEADEGLIDALSEELSEIEGEIDACVALMTIPDQEQQAIAGAIVSISNSGELRIEENLLKPEDKKRFTRKGKTAARIASPDGSRSHSIALVRRLTAHRTQALQATLALRPDMALIALTHRLVLRTFFNEGYSVVTVIRIDSERTPLEQHAPDIESSKAREVLAQQHETLLKRLPDDPETLLAWLIKQSPDQVLRLCAYCVAVSVDGVSSDEDSRDLDPLSKAVALDMRVWWSPTAQHYLTNLPKARILEVVREAVSPEVAKTLESLKKGPLAKAAEEHLKDKGWLPSLLRTQAA